MNPFLIPLSKMLDFMKGTTPQEGFTKYFKIDGGIAPARFRRYYLNEPKRGIYATYGCFAQEPFYETCSN